NFDEIAQIIDGVTHNEKLTVCLDTCHIHDAGYDIVSDFDGVLTEFDKIIGLDRIQVIHVNDSKNVRGASKVRHENIGFGHIGFEHIKYIDDIDTFKNITTKLDTYYIVEDKNNKKTKYIYQNEMLNSQTSTENLRQLILS